MIRKFNARVFLSTSAAALAITLAGCAHHPTTDVAAASGPKIINPRVSNQIIQLSPKMEAPHPTEVMADVKDVTADVSSVKFQLLPAQGQSQQLALFSKPMEYDMKNIGGTTWEARIGGNDLKKLAVSGQDMQYDGRVIAQNSDGK
ncbi:MAG: hypothetical protein ACXVCH_18255, partial [Bdellovibrionota bacterium]